MDRFDIIHKRRNNMKYLTLALFLIGCGTDGLQVGSSGSLPPGYTEVVDLGGIDPASVPYLGETPDLAVEPVPDAGYPEDDDNDKPKHKHCKKPYHN